MERESKEFLFKLLTTPSPSGSEQAVQKVVRARMSKYADTIVSDFHGNLILGQNTKAKIRVELDAHCDQIGFMVKHIAKDGTLWISSLGGVDTGVMLGAQVVIHSAKGPVVGVVGRKPIHLQGGDERNRPRTDIDLLWIDIGAKDDKEAKKRVEVGDPITFKLEVIEFPNDRIVAPALDDKAGLFVIMEAFRLCAEKKHKVALYAVSAVQEELGLRGGKTAAFGIDPHCGIAVDVVHATDNPGSEAPKGIEMILGKGPAIDRGPNCNPVVERLLVKAAKKLKVHYQPKPTSALLGNDAREIQVTRAGVAAGSLGVPLRYMHSQVEICNLKDLEAAAKILAEFVRSLDEKVDFRPS